MTTTRRLFKSLWLPAIALTLAGWSAYRAGASSASPPPPPPAPAVIGLVDMEALMKGLTEVKARNADLQSINDKRQKELDAFAEKLKKIKADLDSLKDGTKERRDKFAEGLEAEAQYKGKGQILGRLSELDEGETVSGIYTKALATIAKVAAKDGYSMVLLDDRKLELPKFASGKEMSSAILNKRILFAAPSLDITDRIILEMNNEYAAPAPRGGK